MIFNLIYLGITLIISISFIIFLIRDDDFFGHKYYEYIILVILLSIWPLTIIFVMCHIAYDEHIKYYIKDIIKYAKKRYKEYKEKRILRLRKKYVKQLKFD